MITLEWVLLAAVASALLTLLVTRALASRAANEPAVTAPSDPVAQFDGAFVRLVRALPIGVILVDRSLRVEFANGSAGAIFGFDSGRVGGHIIEAIHSVEFEGRISEALRGEASVAPFELPGRRGARTYRVSVYPLVEEGDAQRVVVFAEDQTDLVRLDRAR
jgi:PAS domain-containing protein